MALISPAPMQAASDRRFIPAQPQEALRLHQEKGLHFTINHAYKNSPAYAKKFANLGVHPNDIRTLDDITQLPFTTVEDLRDGYPLPLLCVPEEDVVRIHASSGTTGKRKILAYSAKDVAMFNLQMARCYELAGLTTLDRVQICVGYGLWTAGAGFQLGSELFGALTVPVGPGNLEMQLQLLIDMGVTCLGSTASMALLMSEEIERLNLRDSVKLDKVIFGAEPHSKRMRETFESKLGIKHSYNIAGMTEMYGTGDRLECDMHDGIHYWGDLFIIEFIDPQTLLPVQEGEVGEMVVTSLCKEATPLIRYRTRDLAYAITSPCACGLEGPRHSNILGRSDDMFIVKGVNVYPSQINDIIEGFKELGAEYQIELDRKDGKESMHITVEKSTAFADENSAVCQAFALACQKKLLVKASVSLADPGALPRSFGKSRRVTDNRQ